MHKKKRQDKCGLWLVREVKTGSELTASAPRELLRRHLSPLRQLLRPRSGWPLSHDSRRGTSSASLRDRPRRRLVREIEAPRPRELTTYRLRPDGVALPKQKLLRPRSSEVARRSQFGTILAMANTTRPGRSETTIGRAIRFPERLRARIGADAKRCGRSFEGQVLALLRRHYGEDVDISKAPSEVLNPAVASLAGIPKTEIRWLTRKLSEEAGD